MKAVLRMFLAAVALAALAACSNTASEGASADADAGLGAGIDGGALDEGSSAYFTANVGDRVLFATDSSSLDAAAQTTLTFQADWLLRFPEKTVVIEGHADERGTREYNLALGARRAQAVYDYLLSYGVPAERMTTVTYGKERPVSLCSDESCWSQNRRAVSVVAGGVPTS